MRVEGGGMDVTQDDMKVQPGEVLATRLSSSDGRGEAEILPAPSVAIPIIPSRTAFRMS